MRALHLAGLLAMPLTVACSTASAPTGDVGSWQGSVISEGRVSTVTTDAGSVWPSARRFVEELAIGLDEGPEHLLFGSVTSVWATASRIYVVDAQVPSVRVFDLSGRFVKNIGRVGEGPGEYQRPRHVAVTRDGRILVRDAAVGQRVNVYSADGRPVDTWYGDLSTGTTRPPTLTAHGDFYTQTYVQDGSLPFGRTLVMGQPGPDGIQGNLRTFPRLSYAPIPELRAGGLSLAIPFAPRLRRAMTPAGTLIAAIDDEYRLHLARSDGTQLIVLRSRLPLPIDPDEREWLRRERVAVAREFEAGWQWDGAEIPANRPAITDILPDRSGRIWVARPKAVERVADCTEDPLTATEQRPVRCWATAEIFDVFSENTGKLLGQVDLPPGARLDGAFIRNTLAYFVVEDEAGTVRVKRFRLSPGDN